MNTWSPVGGIVCKGLCVASLEEVCHWGWALRLQKPMLLPVSSIWLRLSATTAVPAYLPAAVLLAMIKDSGPISPKLNAFSYAVLPWQLSNRKVTKTPSTFILSVLQGTFFKLTLWLYNGEEKTKKQANKSVLKTVSFRTPRR